MNSNTIEYAIKNDGSMIRRQIVETDVDVNTKVIEVLTAKRRLQMMNVFQIGIQPVHLQQEGTVSYWTLQLATIPMLSPCRITKGVAVPDFKSKVDPVMPMIWVPPMDCTLKMMFMAYPHRNGTNVTVEKAWLFAVGPKKGIYRLPLANVYADCSLCLGQYENFGPTHREGIEKTIDQFQKSKWNADLWEAPDLTQRCFRWKVLDKGFEVMEPDGKWTELSQKISTPVTSFLL